MTESISARFFKFWRQGRYVRREFQGDTVHAIAQPRGRRAVIKDVPEVAATAPAMHFSAIPWALGTPRTQDESSTHRARCGPRAAWICKRPRSSSCGGPTLPKLAARPRSFNGCPLALAVSLLRPRGERPSGGRAAEQRDELAAFHCPVPPVLSTERIPHLSYGRRLLYCGISIGPMTAWVKTEHNPSISC